MRTWKVLGLVLAISVGGFAPSVANASVNFNLADFNISAASSDPGLVIETNKLASPNTNFSLNVGDSFSVDLFRIWTNESVINLLDDLQSQPISVTFSFDAPPPPFGGPVSGSTTGTFAFWVIGTSGGGAVDWAGATLLNFGPNMDGILQIELEDVTFNENSGLFDYSFPLQPGEQYGANVNATFTLLQEASGPGASVPEATSLVIWGGFALAGAVVALRRRQK